MALFAIPENHPRHFRAVEVARECLQAAIHIRDRHLSSTNTYAWAVYCQWMLLNAPVTPFMGVFGQVIADPDASGDDIELLAGFAETLRPATHLSEGIAKFHHLCAVFVQVARAYVQAKTRQTQGNDNEGAGIVSAESPELAPGASDVLGQFDMDLAALGFHIPQQEVMSGADAFDYAAAPLTWTGLLDHELHDFDSLFH